MKHITLFILLWLLVPCISWALNCTLTWTAPTTNADGSPLTDLAGYNTYSATQSGQYGARANTQLLTQTTHATPCTLGQFWIVRAVDTAGNESVNSNEARVTDSIIPGTPKTLIIIIVP